MATKQIPLTQGKFALVDKKDFERLNQFKWTYSPLGYAYRKVQKNNKVTCVYMHNYIIGFNYVDHKNENKLDNRRSNLRRCNHSTNKFNRKKQKNNSSGFKGVTKSPTKGKWIAQIQAYKKYSYLGTFESAEIAHEAYKKAAKKLHGKFAKW